MAGTAHAVPSLFSFSVSCLFLPGKQSKPGQSQEALTEERSVEPLAKWGKEAALHERLTGLSPHTRTGVKSALCQWDGEVVETASYAHVQNSMLIVPS